MQEESLPDFDDSKLYVLSGKTLNKLKKMIIREIIADELELIVKKETNGRIRLRLVNPVPPIPAGDVVLTGQDSELVWENIEDC